MTQEALDLDAAISLARRHKIPRSMMHNVARRVYFHSKSSGIPDIAERVRREYKFQFTLLEMIVEFFRRMFQASDVQEVDEQQPIGKDTGV